MTLRGITWYYVALKYIHIMMISMTKQYYVYIMTNRHNTVLYVGVTNDLKRRIYQHKTKQANSFTKKYNIDKLVYYETCENVNAAITREKQLKGGSRKKKIDLIESHNPKWQDLYDEI
jgi:putative endonuclease